MIVSFIWSILGDSDYDDQNHNTMTPVFKTTWEIGITWKLRTVTPIPMPIQYIEMDLRNKTISEFRTVFRSPWGVPNSQVSLYKYYIV